jgi:choice-of-anchor A domain-containing protein
MKYFALCLFALLFGFASCGLSVARQGQQLTYTFSSFTSQNEGDLQMNGETPGINPNSNGLRITSNEGSQAGSFFLKDPITLIGQNGFQGSFSTVFGFSMLNPGGIGDEDGAGADGIVFIVNSLTNQYGNPGDGIGYGGLGNSVGIEFDSFNNGEPIDINGNHVGIDFNGNVQSAYSVAYPTRWQNGGIHYAWVDYNGETQSLQVRVSETTTRPTNPVLSETINLYSYLESANVYVGFSAGSGSGWEDHYITTWSFTNTFAPIVVPPTAVCGNGVVENGEQCDPPGSCCSSTCQFQSTATLCRTASGSCDNNEYCTGSSATCPADTYQSYSTLCRPASGPCDNNEYCTGSTAQCPADTYQSYSTLCRPASGPCDNNEYCTGSTAGCPVDTYKPTSTDCRASIGPCDPAEYCTGAEAQCPADVNGGFETQCSGLNVVLQGQSYSWLNYDVISFGNFNSNTGDIEGRAAVRDNGNVGYGWSVGYKTHSLPTDETLPYAFIVGDNLSWGSGAIYPLSANSPYGGAEEFMFVGSSFTGPSYLASEITGNCSSPGCMDSSFDALQSCYAGYSSNWAAQVDNTQHDVIWSGLNISCNNANSNTYYLTTNPAELSSFSWVVGTSNCNVNARWIINIEGTGDVTFSGGSFPMSASAVVYNVIGSGRNINLGGYQLNGNLVAPYNNVNQQSGVVYGKVIAGSISASNQFNKATCFFPTGTPTPPSGNHVCGNGIVEQGEQCDGGVCCSSTCSYVTSNSNTICHAATGICDMNEYCTGTSAQCPADTYQPSTYDCRPSIGPCDTAEYCTGNSPYCPTDVTGQFETACSGLTLTITGQTTSWLNYDVIVFGNYNAGTGDIEARAAFQGEGVLGNGWSVGYQTHSSPTDETVDNALIVGGNLNWGSGAIYPNGQGAPFGGNEEYMFVGGTFNGPSYLAADIDGTCSTPNCLNGQFYAVQSCYAGYSANWAAQADNTHHSISYNVLNVSCSSDTSVYYMTLTPTEFTQFTSVNIVSQTCSSNARWIINVVGTGDVTIQSSAFPVASTSAVVWNVQGSGRTIYLQDSELDGSLVAPYNTMSQASGVVKGKVIVGNVATSNQINKYRCFQASA